MFRILRDVCPLAEPIRAHGESLAMHVAENGVWNLARGRAAKGAETCEKQVARPNAPRRA